MTKEEFFNKYSNNAEQCVICNQYLEWKDLENRNFEGVRNKGKTIWVHRSCLKGGC